MTAAASGRSSARGEVEEQKAANESAIPHFAAFEAHRTQVTELLLAAAEGRSSPRLCVLGAGNGYDLDLPRLAQIYAEVHLVDLDAPALERAAERQDEATRAKLHLHAPVDLTGALGRLDAWQRMEVTPDELMAWPGSASKGVVSRLPGPFDVVLSACVLTQLHWAFLNVLSDRHRLYEPLRQLLNVVHLRTVALLLAPSGCGLLVSDLASHEMIAQSGVAEQPDDLRLLAELSRRGRVIHAVDPGFLQWSVREDPLLSRTVTLEPPRQAWRWHVGPDRSFLVFAQRLLRRA